MLEWRILQVLMYSRASSSRGWKRWSCDISSVMSHFLSLWWHWSLRETFFLSSSKKKFWRRFLTNFRWKDRSWHEYLFSISACFILCTHLESPGVNENPPVHLWLPEQFPEQVWDSSKPGILPINYRQQELNTSSLAFFKLKRELAASFGLCRFLILCKGAQRGKQGLKRSLILTLFSFSYLSNNDTFWKGNHLNRQQQKEKITVWPSILPCSSTSLL